MVQKCQGSLCEAQAVKVSLWESKAFRYILRVQNCHGSLWESKDVNGFLWEPKDVKVLKVQRYQRFYLRVQSCERSLWESNDVKGSPWESKLHSLLCYWAEQCWNIPGWNFLMRHDQTLSAVKLKVRTHLFCLLLLTFPLACSLIPLHRCV